MNFRDRIKRAISVEAKVATQPGVSEKIFVRAHLNMLVAAAILLASVLLSLSHAVNFGVLARPHPWDDTGVIFNAYRDAVSLMTANNFRDWLAAFYGVNIHSIASVITVASLLLFNSIEVSYFVINSFAIVIALVAVWLARAPPLSIVAVLIFAPIWQSGTSTFKTDIIGGLAFGAFAFVLSQTLTRDRFSKAELWGVSFLANFAILSKMLSPFNVVFCLCLGGAFFVLRALVRTPDVFVDIRGFRFRKLLFSIIGQLANDFIIVRWIIIYPLLVLSLFWILEYGYVSYYMKALFSEDFYWRDTVPFVERLRTVYFRDVGNVSFLPAHGGQFYGGTVTLSAVVAVLSLFNRKFWSVWALFVVGLLAVCAVVLVSPSANPTFAAPGFGVLHFAIVAFVAVLAKQKFTYARQTAILASLLISSYFITTTSNRWVSSAGYGGPTYEKLIDAIAESLPAGKKNPIIVFSANYSPLPHPNVGFELLRRGNVGPGVDIRRIDEIAKVDQVLSGANVVVLVRVTGRCPSTFVPSCEQSHEIADLIMSKLDGEVIFDTDFRGANFAVLRVEAR